MTETDLREHFGQWAAQLLAEPPPEFSGIRRRARRRLARLAAAAGAGVVVFGVVAGLLASNLGGAARPAATGRWGSARYPAPPGQPYVVVNAAASGPAELRDVATGSVVQVLRPLGNAASFTAIAAAPGDRLFVLAQQGAEGQVSFAALRIGSGPQPAVRLTPVRTQVSLPAGTEAYFMAINAISDRLALDATGPGGTNSLVVYDLRGGGLIGDWTTRSVITPPQFIGGGYELAIDWPVAGQPTTSHRQPPSLALRIVSTATAFPAGSSLLADSAPGPGLHGISGSFSQDGSVSMNTLGGALAAGRTRAGSAVRLLEYSSASGKLLHAIQLGAASALQSQYFCGVLWASPNGRDLITQCGTRQQEVVNGKVSVVRLPWTFPAQLDPSISPFAW